MASNVLITPASSKIEFTDGSNSTKTLNISGVEFNLDSSLAVTSNVASSTILKVNGSNGTLLSVVDDLSDSLLSVNNSAGLPVFEVFADDRIVAGQYGQNDLVLKNNKIGLGTASPVGKLDINGTSSNYSTVWLRETAGNVAINFDVETAAATFYNWRMDVQGIEANAICFVPSTTTGGTTFTTPALKINQNGNVTATTFVGALTGNASTASAIPSHTLWGQNFDGTNNVSGNLTSVGNITGTAGITIAAGGSNTNITLTPNGSGYILLNGSNGATDTTGQVFIKTSDAQGVDVGGQLTLGGAYNSTPLYYAFGGIAGRKENSTNNNVAGYLAFLTTSSGGTLYERARLNSQGNLGLGIVPSVWGTAYSLKAFQVGPIGSVMSLSASASNKQTHLLSNAFYDTTFRYLTSDAATTYYQQSGVHIWQTAVSGIAGATQTIVSGQQYTVTTLGNTTLAQWQAYFSALTVLPAVNDTITATNSGTLAGTGTVTQIVTFSTPLTISAAGLGTASASWSFEGVKVGRGGGGNIYNTAVGYDAFASNTTGVENVSFGLGAGFSNTTGSYNTFIGTYSSYFSTTGGNNTALGKQSLNANRTGSYGTAVGSQALYNNTTQVATLTISNGGSGYANGSYTNVQLVYVSGSTALTYPTANITVSGGAVTLISIAYGGSGFRDTTTVLSALAAALGGSGSGLSLAVATLTTGEYNTALGYQAGYNVTSGKNNTIIGPQAGYSLTTGNNNTFVGGANSGNTYAAGSAITTGGGNTILGNFSGNNSSLDIRTSNNYIVLSDGAGNPRLVINNSGNASIGTVSVINSSKLSIADSALKTSSGNCLTFGTATGGTNDFELIIQRGSNSDGYYLIQAVEQNVGYKNISLNANGGNVAVGFTNPLNRLSVNGSASIGSNYNTAGPANGLIVEGNVGIGITNPAVKLEVAGVSMAGSGSYRASIYGDNGGAYLYFGTSANANVLGMVGTYGALFNINSQNGPISFQFSGTEKARIDNSTGHVGIGITSPSARLHVNSTTSGATLLRADGTNGTLFSVIDDLSDSLLSVNNSAGLPVFEVFADDRVVMGQYNANDFVLKNNKIGIGNSSPNKQLTFAQINDDAIQIRRSTIGQGGPSVGTGISWTWTSATTDNETWAAIRAIFPGSSDSHLTFSTRNTSAVFAEKMRIQNDGNVGIGITNPNRLLTIGAGGVIGLYDSSNSGQGTIQQSASGLELYVGASKYIVLGTNSAERMRIDSNGNVGIGNTTPNYKLDVSGNVNFAGSYVSFNGYGYIRTDNANWFTFQGGTSGYQWRNSSNSTPAQMTLDSNGNLGIGTSSPSGKLLVYTNGNNVVNIKSGSTTNGDTNRLIFTNASGAADVRTGVIEWYDVGTFKGDIRLLKAGGIQIRNSADSATLNLDDSGNLGLGVAPTQAYSLSRAIQIGNGGLIEARTADYTTFSFATNAYLTSAGDWTYRSNNRANLYTMSNGAYTWYTAGASTGTISFAQAMTLDSSGRLLVGTTSLGIGGNGNTVLSLANGGANIYTSLKASGGEEFITGAQANLIFIGAYSNNDFAIRTNNTARLTISAAGNVGIGTSSPAVLLHVGGSSQTTATYGLRFGLDTSANLYRSASATIKTDSSFVVAGTLTELSALKYKENITPLSNLLDQVCKIQPVTYNKKGKVEKEYGVIAEEINELFPELISRNDDGEIESVNYSRLTTLLIQAVKELKIEVDKLKNK